MKLAKYTLDQLKSLQVINPAFDVHPEDAEWIQDIYNNDQFGGLTIKTSVPRYWAAALKGISISDEAKKHRQPKINGL